MWWYIDDVLILGLQEDALKAFHDVRSSSTSVGLQIAEAGVLSPSSESLSLLLEFQQLLIHTCELFIVWSATL